MGAFCATTTEGANNWKQAKKKKHSKVGQLCEQKIFVINLSLILIYKSETTGTELVTLLLRER